MVDATGLETRHASRDYEWRRGDSRRRQRGWPKLTLVCETASYLLAGAVVSPGPSQDSSQFAPALKQACDQVLIDRLLADAAYDAEHHHRLARETFGIRSTVIALNPRRWRRWPKGRYRRQMKRRFARRLYGHRWHVESAISQMKRKLGAELRSTSGRSQTEQSFWKFLTHDKSLLRRAACLFQQSTSGF